jgi:hypothetical protein
MHGLQPGAGRLEAGRAGSQPRRDGGMQGGAGTGGRGRSAASEPAARSCQSLSPLPPENAKHTRQGRGGGGEVCCVSHSEKDCPKEKDMSFLD